jgi:hypothetical protein
VHHNQPHYLPEPDPELPAISKVTASIAVELAGASDHKLDSVAVWRFTIERTLIENLVIPIGGIRVNSENIPIAVGSISAIRPATGEPN